MILGKPTTTEEYIIEILGERPLRGPALNAAVNQQKGETTKQAVYAALRNLIDQEIVTKTGTVYTLNRVWLQKLHSFSRQHIDVATQKQHQTILDFQDGDSVTYKFKDPNAMDVMWGHLYDLVYDVSDQYQVIVNHHPHEWLILARTETEQYWLRRFEDDKKLLLFNIGGNTPIDKQFKSEYQSDFIKINNGVDYGLRPNEYLAVVGDYVFNISVEHAFEQAVDELFQASASVADIKAPIRELAKQKYTSKLKLSKNSKKAIKWRQTFANDYAIPDPFYI